MSSQQLTSDIFYVGAHDWDRRLFDELIPLPDGTTYNAYVIKGSEKTVLLDAVDPAKEQVLFSNLEKLNLPRIDYIISHHAEQDHSGAIPAVLKKYPMAKVVTNPKCKTFLSEHLLIPNEKFIVIKDRETLSLGNKTLQFIFTPWVHWPETMSSFLIEDGILFSCDFFGSHLATSEIFSTDQAKVYSSAKRYFAEIMMPFRSIVRQDLEKVKSLNVKMIAPSHGPVHHNPNFIISAYEDWTSDRVKNEVIIPYISMHGSTETMVHFFIDKLIERDIVVQPFNLSKTDIGELAMALVDAATVVIGSPTVILGAHPIVAHAVFLANFLRPKTRYLSIIGSYGWGGKMVEQLAGMIGNLTAEILPPVIAKGYPKDADFQALIGLADQIREKHQHLS
ncbi:MAG: FprA family A-type flavoprotein [Candidatus Marinimicrobia bacterium]|nr:FprA family A-type flavoprotein [Candidatus Neomarinimicrobiota bacterium]